ncbi:MAG: hypothetical protein HUK22_06825 [Thermoguttaceae bacterium]|nr:hypothetical protein [Thermoguttaceae bacterium]
MSDFPLDRRFPRENLEVFPLSSRVNKIDVRREAIDPATYAVSLSEAARRDVRATADELRRAKELGAARILTYGAHSIKNGLGPVLARLAEDGWLTHLCTNGAGVIHDWEFAYQGFSGEDVKRYAGEGQFGIWEETGKYINLSLVAGAYRGLGYGESVGEMICNDGVEIPTSAELAAAVAAGDPGVNELFGAGRYELAAAAADFLATKARLGLRDGKIEIQHPFREYSVAYRLRRAGVRFTCCPMIGCDIIYTHPANNCAAIGRCAERDFLSYADSVSRLEGGVYLSVGSAVLSPMIFEKSLSMSRNIARREGRKIDDFSIHVVDLARSTWDWNANGEPPADNPAYYLRYCKTFSRMGGRMTYCEADNRSWFVALLNELSSR